MPDQINQSPKHALADPEVQASWFARVREAHQMETIEDYVELIADLINAHKEARASDLAMRLGVANPTVSKMLTRLQDEAISTRSPIVQYS